MSGEHVLTIDLGTSGPKVAMFTLDGRYLDGEFSPVDLVLIEPGGVEQRCDDWWSGIAGAAQRLWSRLDVDPGSVAAVSVTSQWSGTVAVDAEGHHLHNAIIWMDARGADVTRRQLASRIKVAGYDPRRLREWISLTGGAPSHSGKDPISHILFIEEELPEVAEATVVYLEPKDWVNLRLTGRAVATYDSIALHWVTDNRDTMRIDYSASLLEAAGLDRSKLPDLIAATDIVGGLTAEAAEALGLPVDTPVIGGTPDVQSATIGSGAVDDFAGHLYIGTSSWLTCHVPFKRTNLMSGVASLPAPLPGRYFVANEQECAGKALTWLRDNVIWPQDALGGGPPPDDALAQMDALAATVPAGSNGVIFTPWLNGERTPIDDHTIRAGWHQLGLGTNRADLVRSVLEGVALNSRWLLEAVEGFIKAPFGHLNFIGGGANSDLWCQIHADVMDREIRQVEHPIRANARGAALLAAVALGRLTPDEIGSLVPVKAVYRPDPANRVLYDSLFEEFRAIYKATKPIHRRLAAGR